MTRVFDPGMGWPVSALESILYKFSHVNCNKLGKKEIKKNRWDATIDKSSMGEEFENIYEIKKKKKSTQIKYTIVKT